MHCTNCKKEVVEGSEFCPYCGTKLNNEVKTLDKTTEEVEQKIKQKKKIGKGLIIVIICCIALITSAVYFTVIIDNSSDLSDLANNVFQEENKVEIEETVEIPENKRATVTFIEDTGNVIEDREIFDRKVLCEYVVKHNNKVRKDISSINISNAIQKKGYTYYLLNNSGILYYVEYTSQIDGLPETTNTDYGSIIFWDCASIKGSTTNFKILVTIWNPFTNASSDYVLAKEISNQNREDFNQKVNNIITSTIYDFYASDKNYMNVRVGLIEPDNNPWVKEYINELNSITQENVGNTTETVDTEELGNIKLTTTTDNSTKKNNLMEYLQDDKWVQDNLILKKNVFGDAIVSDDQQAIKYNIINDNMIITYTRYQGSGDGMRCSILTFNDGKVNITRFEEGTNRYTDYVINKEKNILYTYYTSMGYTLYQIFGINENNIGIIGYLEMDDYVDHESGNRILKYRFNGEEIDKGKYEELKNQYIVENNNAENKFVTLFEGTNYIEE